MQGEAAFPLAGFGFIGNRKGNGYLTLMFRAQKRSIRALTGDQASR